MRQAWQTRCNKYIDETMPWALAKDESKKERLATVLYNLVESISIGASLLEPFMPETADKILAQLGARKRSLEVMNMFGLYQSGNKVTDKPEILFARLDVKEVLEKVEAKKAADAAEQDQYYIIQEGDSLSSIAFTRYGDADLAAKIAEANDIGIDDNIFVGQKILLPNLQ